MFGEQTAKGTLIIIKLGSATLRISILTRVHSRFDFQILINFNYLDIHLTLKLVGGGGILPIGQEIACHFSQDHTMITKFLDFIHTHPI